MDDYERILSGETRRGWQLLIPRSYFSCCHVCDYGWSKQIEDDDMTRKKHDSSILIAEDYNRMNMVKIRRVSTISPKISTDLAVIRYPSNILSFVHLVYLTPNISGVVLKLHSNLRIVVFNAFSPKEKCAIWKITAPGAFGEYQYGCSMFLDEHSRQLIIIFNKFPANIFSQGFAMVAYELSADFGTILNNGSGTIIYAQDVKVARCISLGDNETIMGAVTDGENGPELGDIITIDRTGIKCRQSVEEWLEICGAQRPDFIHVCESYRKLHINEPANGIFENSSRPFEWYFQSSIMSRCIAGVWYAATDDGILCKRTKVDSLKNLAAKAVVGVYPSEIDGAQLRASMKTVVGFDVFEEVTEEHVEMNNSFN